MSTESIMPPNHFILCCPLLLLPSIFPSIGVFSSELAFCIRWPKYWSFSFSISPSKMRSTEEGNGKPLQHSCLENPMNSMKRLRPWLTAIDVGSRKERGQAQGGGRSRPGSLTHSFLHLDALSCPALPSTHQSHLLTRL